MNSNSGNIPGKCLEELESLGLVVTGKCAVTPSSKVPGKVAGALLLIGNAGPDMWTSVQSDLESGSLAPGSHILDRWTRLHLEPMAARYKFDVFFPFGGPPFLPFQAWAVASGAYFPSPLGLAIHPKYGLWSAFRGAFFTPDNLGTQPEEAQAPFSHPCETCVSKPCLQACPVGAFTPGSYDHAACKAHLRSALGQDCLQRACLARRACPIGKEYYYAPAQAEHHMRAFLG